MKDWPDRRNRLSHRVCKPLRCKLGGTGGSACRAAPKPIFHTFLGVSVTAQASARGLPVIESTQLELYSTSYPIIPSLCHSHLPITQVIIQRRSQMIPAYRFSGSSTQGGVASINRPNSGSKASILHFISHATLR